MHPQHQKIHETFSHHFLWFFVFFFAVAFVTLVVILQFVQPLGPVVTKMGLPEGIVIAPYYLLIISIFSTMVAGAGAFLHSVYKFSHHV